ncbi:VP37D protein, partial [Turnix velox]|nr:VP37D protein [Turnix velox]
IEQFLAQDLPLESFLESFCQSRTRSHIWRTQLEKLQELLQKGQVGKVPEFPVGHRGAQASPAPAHLALLQSRVAPKAFDLSYGFVPAFVIPSEAVMPFALSTAAPTHHLPGLEMQPASPSSHTPSLGSPSSLLGHVPQLSPQHQQQLSPQQKEPPHR